MSFEKVIESAQIRADAGDQGHHSQGLRPCTVRPPTMTVSQASALSTDNIDNS